jgi:L-amino acid N-acyltransferase YncA
MLIRDADARRDAAACAAIYAPYVRDTAISLEERPPTPADFAERIDAITETHPWLVAEGGAGGEVVGYAYGARHRERACYRWSADVAVYVAPRHHRRGVGGALYRTLFELLAEQGFRVACAGVTLPNEASVALHESLGFEPVGIYRNIGWKLGAWRDVGWWQLELPWAQDGHATPREPGPPIRLAHRTPRKAGRAIPVAVRAIRAVDGAPDARSIPVNLAFGAPGGASA